MTQPKRSQGQYRQELQRVLESEAFRHSDSLRRLLEYLGEKSLSDSGSNGLKEYTIGVEAFHKPEDYDPQQDPTIRVLASKLRHKLDQYYGKEGAGNPFRIEIPRGHYELRFREWPGEEAATLDRSLRARLRWWRGVALVLAPCAVVFLALALFWWWFSSSKVPAQAGTGTAWTPELELIWQPFLKSDRPIVLSLGTPLFTKLSSDFFRNPRINDWPDALQSEQLRVLQKALQSDVAVPAYPYTGVGEATGVFLLCRLLHPRRQDLTLERNNTLSWETVRKCNVIFLGPPKFNRHLKDVPADDGFVIERGAVRNARPRPGEPDAYRSTWSSDQLQLLEDYALIYRLPGINERGELMMLASASTEGTLAAVEYVTEDHHARQLVDKVRLSSGQLPRSYQVLIRVEFRQQVPWQISYVTHRVLEQPWSPKQAAR